MFVGIDMSIRDQIRVALFDADQYTEEMREGKNADLLIVLRAVLDQAGLNPDSIQGMAVVVGEGTFTATRLAVTLANTFHYVHEIPLISVSSAELQKDQQKALFDTFQKDLAPHLLTATYSGAPRIHPPKSQSSLVC